MYCFFYTLTYNMGKRKGRNDMQAENDLVVYQKERR